MNIKRALNIKNITLLLFIGTFIFSGACNKKETETSKSWPVTVEQATEKLLERLSKKDKNAIRSTPKDDLTKFHFNLGRHIRNSFGLWQGNRALLKATGKQHPDDASMVIIENTWEQLNTQEVIMTEMEIIRIFILTFIGFIIILASWVYLRTNSLEKQLMPLKDMLNGNTSKSLMIAKLSGIWQSKNVLIRNIKTRYSNAVEIAIKHNFPAKCTIKKGKDEPIINIPKNGSRFKNEKIPLSELKSYGKLQLTFLPEKVHSNIRQLFKIGGPYIIITETKIIFRNQSKFGKNLRNILDPKKMEEVLNLIKGIIEK